MRYRLEHKETYYGTLVGFWKEWGFPVLPITALPESIYVVSQDGIDLYAVPVYETNSSIAWIGFPTSNKLSPKELRAGALGELLKFIEGRVLEKGFELLLTTSDTPKLMESFIASGFEPSDEGVTFYTKRI